MITLIMQGGVFQVPEKCPDCGAVPTVQEMEKQLFPKLHDRPCAFCGLRIRIVSGTWKHFHRPEVDRNTWSMDTVFEEEPYWTWLTSNSEGRFDIQAHVVCAKLRMKYANFTGKEIPKPQAVPEGGMPKEMGLETCTQCGKTPTVEDLSVVAARAYGSGPGPCVYCGKPIKLEKLEVTHFWWNGQHCEKWQWGQGMRWEKTFFWSGYEPGIGSIWLNGHLDCAMRAMPYRIRLGDQPGCCEGKP